MTLKAGVIGAGVFGGHHARKYQADPRVELVGIYDVDGARAKQLAAELGVKAFSNMDNLYDKVQIVTVATPPQTHASAAAAALEYGKHTLIEKPLATSLFEADLLLQVAAANKLVLACGHQERMVFEAMGLFDITERPVEITSIREGTWTGRSADVSVTLDLMVHDLDLALKLIGEGPEAIEAKGRATHGAAADAIVTTLSFGTDSVARFLSSRVEKDRKRAMRIVYPSGEVRVDFLARTFSNTTKFPLNPKFTETPQGADPLGANVSRFIDAVTGAAPRPAVTGQEAFEVLKLALAIDAAAHLPSLN
jgi:predicted dehydrogenase